MKGFYYLNLKYILSGMSLVLACQLSNVNAQNNQSAQNKSRPDWLLNSKSYKAAIYKSNQDVILENGLTRRVFRITPNVACIDYVNLINGRQLLRSVKPEARLTINGKDYEVGGLKGQKENAYLLPEWLDGFTTDQNAFQFVSFDIKPISPYIKWKSKFWASNNEQPTGKMVSFLYKAGAPELKGLTVSVNYELYDGLPLIVKSLTVQNQSDKTFKIDRVVSEVLGMVEEQSAVVGSPEKMAKPQGI